MSATAQNEIALEHVFDYRVLLRSPVAFGRGPYGTRLFYEVAEGHVSGPAITGVVLSGGGDWALVADDGWTRIDVRGQCCTDDGALLYVRYHGLIEPTETTINAARSGGETTFADGYFRAAVEVETGDRRYAWLTRTLLVGRGRLCHGPGVAYEVYRVT